MTERITAITGQLRPPILVVDDDLVQAEIVQRSFRAAGIVTPVEHAASGRECLARVSQTEFSAVILDYSMPDLTGLEVLRQLMANEYDVPVIIVTGQGDESIAVQAMKEGAYDYVVKASNYFKQLPALVAQVIEKHELKTRLREVERATRQRHRELAALNEISTAVNASLDLNLVCEHALEKMLEVMHLHVGGIYLAAEQPNQLTLKAYRGRSEAAASLVRQISATTGVAGTCFVTGSTTIIDDLTDNSEALSEFNYPALTADLKALVCIPLVSKGCSLGVILAASEVSRDFTPDDLQLLKSIANQISVAIENANLFEKTRRQAEEIAAKNRELVEAQERLIEAERRAAIGQIGITVRHEINNPLTAILGQTQLLLMRRDDLSDDIKNRLKTIEQLSLRIRDIVKKLEAIKKAPVTEYISGEYMIDLNRATSME